MRQAPLGSQAADDRILRETRWLAIFIVPFLLAAFVIVYLLPGRDQELFAWNVQPRMTSMILGAAYLGGAYFFTRVALAPRWHWVKIGFLPVTVFAAAMGLATALHWDRFSHGHISFIAWVALYFTTPFLVLAAWLRNRKRDPGTADADEVLMPRILRGMIGVGGGITVLIAAWLFLQPTVIAGVWPWKLTPLTARVVGGLFALTGAEQVCVALDPRWSAVRIIVHSQLIALTAIVLALLLSWNNFNQAYVSTWLFVVGILIVFTAILGMTATFELLRWRRR